MTANCPAESVVQQFVEGSLESEARRHFEEHTAECSHCATLVARLGEALLLARPAPAPEPAVASSTSLPEAGAHIGRYILLEPLGTGAVGVVYAAYDPQLDRQVALKLLRPGRGPEHAHRMVREARLMARLVHPNVVTVHDAGELGDLVFIAMERVTGTSLRVWLAREPHSWRAIVAAFVAAGRGLEAAHKADIVHRDFKPDNVLVADDGRVLVTDFGLARSEDDGPTPRQEPAAAASPMASALVGTPAYMAPEQHRGERADAKSDVFSFCVALWQALFAGHPFGEPGPDLAAAIATGRLRPPPARRDVPRRIVHALEAGLVVDRAARADFATVLQVLDSRATRRWPIALAALLAVAIGIAAWALARSTADSPCRGAAERLAGVWDDTARGALDNALRGSSVPYAEASAATVLAMLDAYAARWVASHDAACRATRVEGAQSEALLDRRMLCLDERRGQLSAAVQVLSRPEGLIVEKAVQVASRLPPIDDCDNLAYVSAVVSPPAAAQAAAVAQHLGALARARALLEAGDADGARTIAVALAGEVASIGYRPLQAEADLLLARVDKGSDPKAAVERLQRAAVAAEASGDNVRMAEIRLQLASILGWHLGDVPGATLWADLAAASIERLGGSPELEARLGRVRADTLFKARRLEEALVAHRANLLYWQRAQPGGLMESDLENQIAIDLAELGRLDDARQAFERARVRRESLLGASHPATIDILGNLAQVDRMQGRAEAALTLTDLVIERREALLGRDHLRVAGDLQNRALMLNDLGRYQEAFEDGQRSVAIKEAHLGADSVELILVLQMLGENAARTGRAALAKEAAQRATRIARAHGPHHPELGRSLYFEGVVAEVGDRCDEAYPMFEAAIAEYEAAGAADDPRVAFALDGAGRCALVRGDAAAAVRWHRRSLAVRDAALGPEHPFLCDSLIGLAEALMTGTEPAMLDEAARALERGRKLASAISRADIVGKFDERLANLSKLRGSDAPP